MNPEDFVCRKATVEDIPFLVETIIQAERSGTNLISYQKVFDLSDDELRNFLRELLQDETPNHEFTYQSYYLVEYQGKTVAGLAGFLEGKDGIPSKIIKANLIGIHLGLDRWKAAHDKLKLLSSIEMDRTTGTLQLECAFTLPGMASKGAMTVLHIYIMKEELRINPTLKIAECQASVDNIPLRKLNALGWVDYKVIESDNDEILKYASSKNRVIRRFYFQNSGSDTYKK